MQGKSTMIMTTKTTVARFVAVLMATFLTTVTAATAQDLTPAGTDVQNTFTLDYEVGGVDQTQINNNATPTSFTVDRRVQLNVTGVQNTNVAAGASDQSLFYGVTNTGNDNHSYELSAEEGGGDFDTDPSRTPRYSFFSYPDTNDDGILQPTEITGPGLSLIHISEPTRPY